MRGNNTVGIVGGGLLIVAIVFAITDPKLFDHWYDWVFAPIFFFAGGTLMVAWAWGSLYALDPAYRRQGRRSAGIHAASPAGVLVEGQDMERRRQERRREHRRKADVA